MPRHVWKIPKLGSEREALMDMRDAHSEEGQDLTCEGVTASRVMITSDSVTALALVDIALDLVI